MRTIIAIFVFCVANISAFAQLQNSAPTIDTTIKTISADPSINNLKKGFKNLFVASNNANDADPPTLNPQAMSFVEAYVSRHSKQLNQMKSWGKPYFDLIDEILLQHGLPLELKYLAVIESNLKSNIQSWAGAVGPWQLMPATARQYGLRVSRSLDERTDYHKSTHTAARILKDLYKDYGDWLLVVAAYNGGAGNVNKAIRRSGSHNFWTLQYKLPNESKDHVKKFIATHYIMEGAAGATTQTKQEQLDSETNISTNLSVEEMNGSTIALITGRYSSSVICKQLLMAEADFKKYNPGFDKRIAKVGNYELRLPKDKMLVFSEKKHDILNESLLQILSIK